MNEINISRLVDTTRLRPFHLWLISWCLLAMMADGFDLLNASVAGPALNQGVGHQPRQLGSSIQCQSGRLSGWGAVLRVFG
jgi:hypothetical protein